MFTMLLCVLLLLAVLLLTLTLYFGIVQNASVYNSISPHLCAQKTVLQCTMVLILRPLRASRSFLSVCKIPNKAAFRADPGKMPKLAPANCESTTTIGAAAADHDDWLTLAAAVAVQICFYALTRSRSHL